MKTTTQQRRALRTQKKVRAAVAKTGRARLTVFKSSRHIYAQVIDDAQAKTVASACTTEKSLAGKIKVPGNVAAAEIIGKAVAERATKAGIKDVVFDRGSFKYHGRIKALADAAREAGLNF